MYRAWSVFPALCAVCVVVFGGPVAEAATKVPSASFMASFDGTVRARYEGRTVEPVTARGLRFVAGVHGQAVYIGGYGQRKFAKAPLLSYRAGNLFAGDSGTVMFWFQPDWEGRVANPWVHLPWYHLLTAYAGSVERMNDKATMAARRLTLFMWNYLRCDLYRGGGKKPFMLGKYARASFHRGDWVHMTITWHADGWSRLYLNGLPYQHGQYPRGAHPNGGEAKLALNDIKEFVVGGTGRDWSGFMRAKGAFDDLRIYRQALNSKQVSAVYRETATVDLELDRRFVLAGRKQTLKLDVWPGGRVAVPATGVKVPTPIGGKLTLSLVDLSGRVLSSRTVDQLALRHKRVVTLAANDLAAGEYLLRCRLDHGGRTWQQSFQVVAYRPQPAAPVSDKPVKLGPVMETIACTGEGHGYVEQGGARVVESKLGAYRQAGDSVGSRFSYVLSFAHPNGHPVELAITWPDDKPRSMALYMYRDSGKLQRKENRDRLEGGIQSGVEYPLTHRMQTTRYLFYPWVKHYLFEARTKINGYPAAVARIEVRPVVGRLPKLAIRTPRGLPQRYFGDVDEDQSFEQQLDFEPPQRFKVDNAVKVVDKLLDYFDYTGQNTLAYPFARYGFTYTPLPGSYNGPGLRTEGWQDLMLDMFARRGKRLTAIFNLYNLPTVTLQRQYWARWRKDGWFLTDRRGRTVRNRLGQPHDNPANPAIRRLILNQLERIVSRYAAHPAFGGVEYWVMPDKSPLSFGSLDQGYGDWTVHRFEADTGKHVGAGDAGTDRFQRRYEILTGRLRAAWLGWRAQQVTSLIAQAAKILHKRRPDLPLIVSVGRLIGDHNEVFEREDLQGFKLATHLYEDYGIDVKALQQLPGVVVGPIYRPTLDRWLAHRAKGAMGVNDELGGDVSQFHFFRRAAGTSSEAFMMYFESFKPSLKPKTYRCYFENADVKPWGRFFLQTLGLELATTDADRLLIGGQPLGTAGRDGESREFAQAYRALPGGRFRDAPGQNDPVVVRYRQTAQGVYVYALNMIDSTLQTRIGFNQAPSEVEDLSSGKMLAISGNSVSLELKPFQLRSLHLPGAVVVTGQQVQVPQKTRAWYRKELAHRRSQVAKLIKSAAAAGDYTRVVEAIERDVKRGAYADAYRLLISKRMRELPELTQAAEKGYLREQAQMIRRGDYAVNCGSSQFYRATDGTLFFPDQRYRPGGYGYESTRLQVGRNIAHIRGTRNRELYASESFNITAYHFTVPKGRYVVTLYLKTGYPPGAAVGRNVFNLDVQGKRLVADYDVYLAQGKNFNKALTLTLPAVKVTDGVLDLNYSVPAGVSPTVRFADAIKVRRVK